MKSESVSKSLAFVFAEKITVKLIGFVISVLLARLLDPGIFGTVAIISAVVALTQIFVDSGFNVALIQNKTTTYKDYSTVFYICFGIAAIGYSILYFTAPLILTFYEIPEYVWHFRVLAITLLFYAYNSIQTAKLTKEMAFDKMLICQAAVSIVSGAISVALAFVGYGIWALILYYVLSSFLSCVTYSIIAKWHPQLVFSFKRAKIFARYGSHMLASGILCSVFSHLRTFIIGKLYTEEELGLYNRGEQIPNIISTTVDSAFNSVMLPAFSKNQDNPGEILGMLRKTIALNSYINFPAMAGLAALASTAVTVIYSAKWALCVPFVQLMALANLTVSINSPCLVSIKAIGRSDVYFKLETIRRIVMIAILVGSLLFGSLSAIAVGWLISSVVDTLIVMYPTKKYIGYQYRYLFADTAPQLITSAIMAAGVLLAGLIPVPDIALLFIRVAIGFVIYWLLSVAFKLKSYTEVKKILSSFIKRKSKHIETDN